MDPGTKHGLWVTNKKEGVLLRGEGGVVIMNLALRCLAYEKEPMNVMNTKEGKNQANKQTKTTEKLCGRNVNSHEGLLAPPYQRKTLLRRNF